MPITIQQLTNNEAQLTFDYDGASVSMTYYPNQVTEKTIAQLQTFSQSTEETLLAGFESFNAVLCSLIKAWDVFEDEAQTQQLPITLEKLKELPLRFRSAVMDAILTHVRPEEQALKK